MPFEDAWAMISFISSFEMAMLDFDQGTLFICFGSVFTIWLNIFSSDMLSALEELGLTEVANSISCLKKDPSSFGFVDNWKLA